MGVGGGWPQGRRHRAPARRLALGRPHSRAHTPLHPRLVSLEGQQRVAGQALAGDELVRQGAHAVVGCAQVAALGWKVGVVEFVKGRRPAAGAARAHPGERRGGASGAPCTPEFRMAGQPDRLRSKQPCASLAPAPPPTKRAHPDSWASVAGLPSHRYSWVLPQRVGRDASDTPAAAATGTSGLSVVPWNQAAPSSSG